MGSTVRSIGKVVHNVLDQTIGKVPDLIQDPKGTIGDLSKIKPLRAAGNFVEDVVGAGVDVLGGMSRDVAGLVGAEGLSLEDVEKLKKLPLHDVFNPKEQMKAMSNALGVRSFYGLDKRDVNLFRQLGGQLAQESKTKADIGGLIPQEKKVTESTVMKKIFTPNVRREYEGAEKSQVEREIMGLARMYAGRQQAIRSGQRRPGQKESLLTRR